MRLRPPDWRSISDFLVRADPRVQLSMDVRTEGVRQAMLRATPRGTSDQPPSHVFRRIYYADNVHALWYARSDLMAAIAHERGEASARQELDAISWLFDGLLPEFRSYSKSALPAVGIRRSPFL